MPKRNLKVSKWIGTTPAVAVCTFCNRDFKVTLAEAKHLASAQDSLRRQFSAHDCESTGADIPQSDKQ